MSTQISPGTKIRATWTTTIEGIYDRLDPDGHCVSQVDGNDKRVAVWRVPLEAEITTFLADEPDIKSVVLDGEGDAWQRFNRGWVCASNDNEQWSRYTWAQLNEELGPITFLYST